MAQIKPVPVEGLEFFEKEDAWGYQTNPHDRWRKQVIIHTVNLFGPFSRCLDLGAHEGWITKDIPASTRHGYELSDVAAARFPPLVKRECEGKYDLVLATGVLYGHYDWRHFVDKINAHSSKIVLTCNITSWELMAAILAIKGKQVYESEFIYREHFQKLRVFNVSSS